MSKKHGYLISVVPLTRIPLTRDQSFFYTHPTVLESGTIVSITIGSRELDGVVLGSHKDFARAGGIDVKPILEVKKSQPLTPKQISLAQFISESYYASLGVVLKNFIFANAKARRKKEVQLSDEPLPLPEKEKVVCDKVLVTNNTCLLQTTNNPFSHEAIAYLAGNLSSPDNQILFLVPEKTQIPIYEKTLRSAFGESLAVLAADTTKGQETDEVKKIRSGEVRFILATRRGIFLPFNNVDAVFILESHDFSHKQSLRAPRYDARDCAVELSKLHGARTFFLSSSPLLKHVNPPTGARWVGNFSIFSLPARPAAVEVVDMKMNYWELLPSGKRRKTHTPLSPELIESIKKALAKKEKALLFINRQGMASFSVCMKCKTVFRCPTCERALVEKSTGSFSCLHCNYKSKAFPTCPKCKSPEFRSVGMGTELIEKECKKHFPGAKTAVADSSTMKRASSYRKLYDDFTSGKIDVLIGTQMATKGWDMPDLTLAAIIDMDSLLESREYDGHERAYQYALQLQSLVSPHGKLLIQAFDAQHELLANVVKNEWKDFIEEEDGMRALLKYPPHARLILLTYQSPYTKDLEEKSEEIYEKLSTLSGVTVSEPTDPLVSKVRSNYRKNILIKLPGNEIPESLHEILVSLDTEWIIDVDPVSIS